MKLRRYSFEIVPDEGGSFVVLGDALEAMGRAAHEERERIIAILTDPMNNILLKIPTGEQFIHADPREIRQALEPKL